MIDAIDYVAVRNTIASESDVELLRGTLVILLGVVEKRRQTLAKLDPIEEPAFRKEESDRIRSVMPQTHELEVIRALVREVFKAVESLDVQIARRRG